MSALQHTPTSTERDLIEEKPALLSEAISSGTISISPELFEKLYLTPKTPHAGDNIKRFANPTPLGLLGFVIADMTFAMIMMGWGGASGLSPVVGMFFFVGPVLLILTAIFEWIMGNFFSMMVSGMFSVFWLSFGMLQLPTLGLAAPYSTTGTNAIEGAASPAFNAVLALYLTTWGFALFTFFIFTLRTNVVFALVLLFATVPVWVLSGVYWKLSTGDYSQAGVLQKTGGALFFIDGCLGWYMIVAMMAVEMRMPIPIPVGDLSRFWPRSDIELGRAERDV